MDLSAFTTEAKIDFWYQQPTWGGDQNVLKVYYRAAAGDAWTMIWSDLTSKTTWTAASVILPSVSTTYQIAFEGTSAYGYSIVLDDVEVTGQGPAQPQYVWSPVAGLYTDAAATVAYTGQALATVYAAPATSTVYSVSSSNASGCTSGTSVDITVTTVDMPEGAAIQTFTDGETVADLDVSGTDLTWYSDADATNVIPSTTVLVEGTSYYVTQTVDDCESNPLTITAQNDLSASGFVRENLQAFPNPVTDVLKLKFVDAIQRIVITNLLGQTIRTQSAGDIEARINFSGLASGTYHVTVTTVSGSHTLKIVKR